MNINNIDFIKVFIANRTFYYIDGSNSFARLPFDYVVGLFSQTEDSAIVSGTTTETSILGDGVGALSIPANSFEVGDSFHVKIGGDISAANAEGLTIKIKSGNVVLVTTGILNLSKTTGKVWEMEIDFTIRAIGAAKTASIKTNGQFTHNKDASNVYDGVMFNSTNDTTFDTTIENTLDVTVEWSSNSPSDSINSTSMILSRSYYTLPTA